MCTLTGYVCMSILPSHYCGGDNDAEGKSSEEGLMRVHLFDVVQEELKPSGSSPGSPSE